MKLDELWIEDFKNLKDFRIKFDEKSFVTILIGWNGTGKSYLIEALVTIFRDLRFGAITPFSYELKYICHGNYITINNNPTRPPKERLQKTIKPLAQELYNEAQSDLPYLPNFVFGYYSGSNTRLKELFLKTQEDYYYKLLYIEKYPEEERELRKLRPFFYAEYEHSKFVLLSFFLKKDEKIDKFLKEYFRIEKLESVLFIMKKPSWTSKEGDPRFWNARGVVQQFLDRLYGISLAPMRIEQIVSTGLGSRKKQEFLYLFIKDAEVLSTLAQDYDTPSDFFASLESTYLSEVISDVRIKMRIRNHDGSLTFRELSEGEQQLFMVLGLLRFTREKESLILLDEPDTHLNPFWSTEYLELLKKIVDDEDVDVSIPEEESRHIIMLTHDPLVIAGLKKEQVQILKRDDKTGHSYAEIPERDPQGMGFEGILTSDMFGFRSALDKPTLELLDKKRRLAIKDKENLTDDDKLELKKLNQRIGELDFTNVVRDDYYKMFAQEMAKYEEQNQINEIVLTSEQILARKKKAQEIATKIAEKKKKESNEIHQP